MAALPPLASIEQLAELLGEDVVTDGRALALLEHASTLVRSQAGLTWVDAAGDLLPDIPPAASEVTAAVAARAWRRPDDTVQETTGPFSATFGGQGIYLTKWEKSVLQSDQVTGRSFGGISTITTTGGDTLDGRPPIPAFPPRDGFTLTFQE